MLGFAVSLVCMILLWLYIDRDDIEIEWDDR